VNYLLLFSAYLNKLTTAEYAAISNITSNPGMPFDADASSADCSEEIDVDAPSAGGSILMF
jgi:hypothetical protein